MHVTLHNASQECSYTDRTFTAKTRNMLNSLYNGTSLLGVLLSIISRHYLSANYLHYQLCSQPECRTSM